MASSSSPTVQDARFPYSKCAKLFGCFSSCGRAPKPSPRVRNVNWSISRGEVLALVGESGFKSVSRRSHYGLAARMRRRKGDHLEWPATRPAPNAVYRQLRGNRICLVPQDPMASLNPVYTIGYQIREGLRAHQKGLTEAQIAKRVISSSRR